MHMNHILLDHRRNSTLTDWSIITVLACNSLTAMSFPIRLIHPPVLKLRYHNSIPISHKSYSSPPSNFAIHARHTNSPTLQGFTATFDPVLT